MHLWRCWELSLSGIVEVKVRICREETIKSEYIVYGIGQMGRNKYLCFKAFSYD